MILRIKEAIAHYNSNVRGEGQPKMTQKVLAEKVMPQVDKNTRQQIMSGWANGRLYSLNKLHPVHIEAICVHTRTDPNFLYDFKPMKQQWHKEKK